MAEATFGGDIAIADGVAFAATNGVNWAEVKAVPVARTTASVVAFPAGRDADGRHFFAGTRSGVTTLYYGKQKGLVVIMK